MATRSRAVVVVCQLSPTPVPHCRHRLRQSVRKRKRHTYSQRRRRRRQRSSKNRKKHKKYQPLQFHGNWELNCEGGQTTVVLLLWLLWRLINPLSPGAHTTHIFILWLGIITHYIQKTDHIMKRFYVIMLIMIMLRGSSWFL